MDTRTEHSVKNIITGIFNKIVLMFLPFIVRTVMVRTIGVEFLGLNGLFSSILQVLNLTELGFGSALIYSMYKPVVDHDIKKINALLKLYRKVYVTIGFVLLGGGLLIAPFLPKLIHGNIPEGINIYILYLLYLSSTSFSYIIFADKKSLLEAYQRFDVTVNINTCVTTILYIVQICILITIKNYYIYLVVMPIMTIIENLWIAYEANRKLPECKPQGRLEKEDSKAIITHVKGLALQKICSTSRNSFDSIVISMYLGLSLIAIYNNYLLIITAVHAILYQVTNAIRASVGNSIASQNIDKNYSLFIDMTFIYMWISTICTCCLMSLYQPFMEIWMGKSMMCELVTVILFCVYFYEMCFSDVIGLFKDGAGLWWQGRYRTVLEAILNLILNFVLGYFWGLNGILLATIITMGGIGHIYGGYIVFYYYFKNIKYRKYLMFQIGEVIATLICVVITYILCLVIPATGILKLIINVLICLTVPNVLLFLLYFKTSYLKNSFLFIKNTKETFIRKEN